MRLMVLILSGVCVLAIPAAAERYIPDHGASVVAFAGTHAGDRFAGVFGGWDADIVFDPAALDSSSIRAVFKADSAKTGNKTYDGTLLQEDWFDAQNHPEIIFQSVEITSGGDGVYTADGDLTIKDFSAPLSFDFTVSDLGAPVVKAKADFAIDRFLYNIGSQSDPDAVWVSQMIDVNLDISATVDAPE